MRVCCSRKRTLNWPAQQKIRLFIRDAWQDAEATQGAQGGIGRLFIIGAEQVHHEVCRVPIDAADICEFEHDLHEFIAICPV